MRLQRVWVLVLMVVTSGCVVDTSALEESATEESDSEESDSEEVVAAPPSLRVFESSDVRTPPEPTTRERSCECIRP